MRIYCETVGIQGVKPNSDFLMGPRQDGAVYLTLTASDRSAIDAATPDEDGNILVRFEHPAYVPSELQAEFPEGVVHSSKVRELFRQAAHRAANLFGQDVRHKVVEIVDAGRNRDCN